MTILGKLLEDLYSEETHRAIGQQRENFLQLVNAYDEFNGGISVEYFIIGFPLGAKLLIETLA